LTLKIGGCVFDAANYVVRFEELLKTAIVRMVKTVGPSNVIIDLALAKHIYYL